MTSDKKPERCQGHGHPMQPPVAQGGGGNAGVAGDCFSCTFRSVSTVLMRQKAASWLLVGSGCLAKNKGYAVSCQWSQKEIDWT